MEIVDEIEFSYGFSFRIYCSCGMNILKVILFPFNK